ncbi:MAG TPA: right-handed parallel beta-helix repeat-containing protein [Gemmatimonadales bacterium]|nr:right-handed parallel beta-helix repeat-containing protein [Gemmatimonadales bacterium]
MRLRMLLALTTAPALVAGQQAVPFTPGMVITASTRIVPGSYTAPAGEGPGITIRGDGVTLDLSGVELVGNADRSRPDRFSGTAIVIEGGSNITVRGGTVRGYKVAVLASGTRNLRLLGLGLSHNRKPRLYSGIEKESLVDWMSFHQNEQREWLDKGAAIYLEDVTGGEIKDVKVRQGMNGLLMTRTDSMLIWNNDFSFNSALGIGMYRSSHNTIAHNRIDWNVRGYSHGFYNRGQDSAGLLMYEQSSHNVVAFNSVTHSGDGLFLWAGQHTMDTGEGGANDNLFYGNDFSHAPTNGIEATFSRNVFVRNRVEENWHGIWGGYSWQSQFIANTFRDNDEAIAIEHGQDIRITGNTFDGDTTAIRLWWNRVEPGDWGYPKHRDTRSRDYVILGNSFADHDNALRIENTRGVRIDGNRFTHVDTLLRSAGDTARIEMTAPGGSRIAPVPIPPEYVVRPLRGGMNPMIPRGTMRGRETIIVDRWGPYDWKSPKLWPLGRSNAVPQRLRVLGPPGNWKLVGLDGVVSVSAEAGSVGDTLVVVPTGGREHDWKVELEYTGQRFFITPFGDAIAAGIPWRFGWERFEPRIEWHLEFRAIGREPFLPDVPVVATRDTARLDLTWYRPPKSAIPQASVRTTARGTVTLAPGRYIIRTIADDAVWVSIDGSTVLEDPVEGESRVKEVEFVATGRHEIVVQHVQREGWYELRLDIERVE